MSIEIVARDMSPGGTGHEHITTLYWVERPTGSGVNASDRAEVVRWIEGGGDAFVERPRIKVGVVTPRYGQKYLRTSADGQPTNNLLNLPTGAQLGVRR